MDEVACDECGALNPVSNDACSECGEVLSGDGDVEPPLGVVSNDDGESSDYWGEIASLRNQVRQATTLLLQVQERIGQLERRWPSGAAAANVVQRPAAERPRLDRRPAEDAADPTVNPGAARIDPTTLSLQADAEGIASAGAATTDAAGDGSDSGKAWWQEGLDWELLLGRNWFAIVGAVALVFGTGFFLKLAFDNNWIGDTGRVVLGIVVGLALLGVGEYTQRKVPVWAQPVTAGGAGILYLSFYAAFGLYELIRPDIAFGLLALVVIMTALLALRYESRVIGVLGIIGAFLSPLLLGLDLPDVRLVLVYILLVDVGILAVSTFRNWRWFTLLGWIGSYGLFVYWLEIFPDYDAVLVQIALSGVFLVLAAATTLFHLLWRRTPNLADLALMSLNAAAYFALTYGILSDDYDPWLGPVALGMTLFYGLIAFTAIRRPSSPAQIALFALTIAMVSLTIAVPLQLGGIWITVAWAAEGAVLVWAGFLLSKRAMRVFGLGVLVVALGNLVLVDLLVFGGRVDLYGFNPVLNERFLITAVTIAAFYATAFFYWRNRDQVEVWERFAVLPLVGIANLLTLALFSLEARDFFDSRPPDPDAASGEVLANHKYLTLTAVWSIYATAMLAVALWRRFEALKWAGLGLIGVAVLKLLAVDTLLVQLDPLAYTLILNWHFATFVLVFALLLGIAYWLWRETARWEGWQGQTYQGVLVVANLVAMWALCQEAVHFFESMEVRQRSDYFSAKQLTLTILWAVYAIGVIAFGIARQSSRIRLAGMAILAAPVFKLFASDVFLLEREYRVVAFVVLGAMLLGTGLVYQRYNRAIRGFLFGQHG